MKIPVLSPIFSSTFAPDGTGKVPIDAFTLTVRPGLDELNGLLDGLIEADAAGEAEDPVDLEAAGLDAATVIPAEHAASDRPAAQVAKGSAAQRYLFILGLTAG
jgi:hypothetical protein